MFKYLLLLSCAVVALPANAQETGVETEADAQARVEAENTGDNSPVVSPRDDVITVTATGLSTDVRSTGQSVTVIGQDEIESVQGADIARVLTRVPSVSIVRNGPLGSFTGVSVRGAASEQLLVLIDGVRVADQASPGGGFDFGTLLATNVAAIDLLRGANSTIWGADALGGVLDISTRGRSGVSASLEYGARDTLTAAASGAIEGERYALGLTGSALRSEGFSAAAAGTELDGLRQFGLGGSAFVDLTDTLEAFVSARYAEGDLEIDGFLPDFSFGDTFDTQHTRQYSGAAGLNYFGQDLTLRVSYALSDTERTNAEPSTGPTFASDGHTDSLTLRGEYRAIGGLTLGFGGEHQWSSYRTSPDDARADVQITGGYLQAGWVLGPIAAHLGARVDDHELFGSEISFGGDISYGLGGEWRVKASVGEGFKAPTLFQLFSDYGNEALRPERSMSYDAGLEYGRREGAEHFAVTLYRRDSEDLIGFASCFGNPNALCAERPFGYYENISRARAEGIEIEVGRAVAEGFRIAGVYAYVDSEDRLTGRDLPRRPRHTATLYADYATPFGLSLGADLRLTSGGFDSDFAPTRLDGYELLDLRAAFDIIEGIELFGRVENVFDADYQTVTGYGTAGRGAFIGVRGRM